MSKRNAKNNALYDFERKCMPRVGGNKHIWFDIWLEREIRKITQSFTKCIQITRLQIHKGLDLLGPWAKIFYAVVKSIISTDWYTAALIDIMAKYVKRCTVQYSTYSQVWTARDL
jgi:hypothetical protein